MKIKTSELIGTTLDWAVAECLGLNPRHDMKSHGLKWPGWWVACPEYKRLPFYSTNWSQGGPLIEREGISLKQNDTNDWNADMVVLVSPYTSTADAVFDYPQESGPTPLIAAMRCYVTSKIGDTIEVPT